MLAFLPHLSLDAPGRVGSLQAADLHRSIGISATPPSSWPGRELRKYHCLEVPEGCLFTFQGAFASGGSPFEEALAVVIVYLKVLRIFRRSYFRFRPFIDPKNSKNRRSHLRFFVDAHISVLRHIGIKKPLQTGKTLPTAAPAKGQSDFWVSNSSVMTDSTLMT